MRTNKLFKEDIESIKRKSRLSKRAQAMLLQSEVWFLVSDYKLDVKHIKEQKLN